MKYKVIFALLIVAQVVNAQNREFRIRGEANYYNNKEIMIETVLTVLNDSAYTNGIYIQKQNNLPFNIISIKDNLFEFSGELSYPFPFEITYYNEKDSSVLASNYFFVDAETTNISIEDLTINPKISIQKTNLVNTEFQKINESLGIYKKEKKKMTLPLQKDKKYCKNT